MIEKDDTDDFPSYRKVFTIPRRSQNVINSKAKYKLVIYNIIAF